LMQPHLDEFFELLLRYLPRTDLSYANSIISDIAGGQVEISPSNRPIPRINYRDKNGYVTPLERTGSGTIELFPLALFTGLVKDRGLLFIEEPEAHLEVRAQQKLVNALVGRCIERGISTIMTTHSDFVIYSLLRLVSIGKLSVNDLAVYGFERKPSSLTTVSPLSIDDRGKIEKLPPFDEALSILEESDLDSTLRK
jgi:hypothetical protein